MAHHFHAFLPKRVPEINLSGIFCPSFGFLNLFCLIVEVFGHVQLFQINMYLHSVKRYVQIKNTWVKSMFQSELDILIWFTFRNNGMTRKIIWEKIIELSTIKMPERPFKTCRPGLKILHHSVRVVIELWNIYQLF